MKKFLFFLILISLCSNFSYASKAFLKAFEAYKAGSMDEALAAVEKDLKQEPKSAAALELKGKILLEKKLFAKAKQNFAAALDADPQFLQARLSLGDVAFLQRSWNEALYHYVAFYKKSKETRDVLLKIIYCQIASNQLAEANRLCTGFTPSDSEHPGYYFARAAVERASGNDAKALSLLQQVQTHYGITTYQRYLRDYLWIFKQTKPSQSS